VTAGSDEFRVRSQPRAFVVVALAGFFVFGCAVSSLALASLLLPSSPLRYIWRINPRALEAFGSMGSWAYLMLVVIAAVCALSAVGVWRRRRWGYALAIAILAANMVGDAANAVFGNEHRAAAGVLIVGVLLVYLTRSKVRAKLVEQPMNGTSRSN